MLKEIICSLAWRLSVVSISAKRLGKNKKYKFNGSKSDAHAARISTVDDSRWLPTDCHRSLDNGEFKERKR